MNEFQFRKKQAKWSKLEDYITTLDSPTLTHFQEYIQQPNQK